MKLPNAHDMDDKKTTGAGHSRKRIQRAENDPNLFRITHAAIHTGPGALIGHIQRSPAVVIHLNRCSTTT